MFKEFVLKYFLPFNILFDIILIFFERGGVVPIARASLTIFLILYVSINNPHKFRYYGILFLYTLYILINVLFSSDILRSLNISLKVIVSVLTFIIGFNLVTSLKDLRHLNTSVFYLLIILVLNFIFSTALGIGESVYSEDTQFLTGNLRDNWNVFTYSLLVTPLIFLQYNFDKTKTTRLFFLSLFAAIILLLSIKRIAILGVLIGLLIYALFNFKLSKVLKFILPTIAVLLISSPLYKDVLLKRIEARSDRFQEGSLENEARYMETFYVWDEVFSFQNPIKSLFGLEGFNSAGNYAGGKFGQRNLHVDYNLIVNTTGLIGLLMYFLVFASILHLFFKFYSPNAFPKNINNSLKGVFFALFFTQFITSFAGQMYAVTFRTLIFIYLGAILSLYYKKFSLK